MVEKPQETIRNDDQSIDFFQNFTISQSYNLADVIKMIPDQSFTISHETSGLDIITRKLILTINRKLERQSSQRAQFAAQSATIL